jgi:hypothetical protein
MFPSHPALHAHLHRSPFLFTNSQKRTIFGHAIQPGPKLSLHVRLNGKYRSRYAARVQPRLSRRMGRRWQNQATSSYQCGGGVVIRKNAFSQAACIYWLDNLNRLRTCMCACVCLCVPAIRSCGVDGIGSMDAGLTGLNGARLHI